MRRPPTPKEFFGPAGRDVKEDLKKSIFHFIIILPAI
jgi:hypothetical protein